MLEKLKLAISGFVMVLLGLSTIVPAQKIAENKLPDGKQGSLEAANHTKPVSENNSNSADDNHAFSEGEENDEEEEKALPEISYKLRRGEKELYWEMGVSPFNPSNFAGPKEYDVYGRDLHLSKLRFGRIIGTTGFVTYQYFFSAAPMAVFTKNEVKNPRYISKEETPNLEPTVRRTSWGVGIQPVNFRFLFLPKSRVKPFAQVGAGFLLTSKAVPVPYSQPLNFTGDFGGGIQYFTSRRRAVTFGYKYFHISNGNVGGKEHNPGYNANVFYFGYSIFLRK